MIIGSLSGWFDIRWDNRTPARHLISDELRCNVFRDICSERLTRVLMVQSVAGPIVSVNCLVCLRSTEVLADGDIFHFRCYDPAFRRMPSV